MLDQFYNFSSGKSVRRQAQWWRTKHIKHRSGRDFCHEKRANVLNKPKKMASELVKK